MKDIGWMINYLQAVFPSRDESHTLEMHSEINNALIGFLDALRKMDSNGAVVSFLVGDGKLTAGRHKSPVVLAFIHYFDSALLQTYPVGSGFFRELATRGCYLPISNYLFQDAEVKVKSCFERDKVLSEAVMASSDCSTYFYPRKAMIESTDSVRLYNKAKLRFRYLSDVFNETDGFLSHPQPESGVRLEKDLVSLRCVSEVLLAISQLGEKTKNIRSSFQPQGRAKSSEVCDICFRHVIDGFLYCESHHRETNENAYRYGLSKKLIRTFGPDHNYFDDSPENVLNALPIKAKTKSIQRVLFEHGLVVSPDFHLVNHLVRVVIEQPWLTAGNRWWELFRCGFPFTFKHIKESTKNCSSWSDTISAIWTDLENKHETTTEPDISIYALIEAEAWYESSDGYSPRVDSRKNNRQK